jgi:hypothetical protein
MSRKKLKFLKLTFLLLLFSLFFDPSKARSAINHTANTWLSDQLSYGATGSFDVIFSDNNSLNQSSSIANDEETERFKNFLDDKIDNKMQVSRNGEIVTSTTGSIPSISNEIYSLPVKIFLSTLASTASLITICGNLLVMISFFLDRQIRNPTNYFILSLSMSDFVIGLVSIPFLTFYLMVGEWPFGEIICNIWLSIDYTVCLTSIYTVLFITIDRFCSVKMPAKYRKWRSPNKIIVMVILTWVVPISLFLPSIFGWSYLSGQVMAPNVCDVAWSSNKVCCNLSNSFTILAYIYTFVALFYHVPYFPIL